MRNDTIKQQTLKHIRGRTAVAAASAASLFSPRRREQAPWPHTTTTKGGNPGLILSPQDPRLTTGRAWCILPRPVVRDPAPVYYEPSAGLLPAAGSDHNLRFASCALVRSASAWLRIAGWQ